MEILFLILLFGFLSRIFGGNKRKRRRHRTHRPFYSSHQNDYENYHQDW